MRTILFLALLLAASAAAAAGFFQSPGGTQACSASGLKPGETCYARLTLSDGNAFIGTGACTQGATVSMVANVSDDTDHDASCVVKRCPAGAASGSDEQCRAVLGPLTGAAGADAIYGILAQNVAGACTVPASQTAQLEVSCY